MCVTVIILGIGTWGFIILEQEFDPIWFLPTDSYPYKFDGINDNYFTTSGVSAAVYCSRFYNLVTLEYQQHKKLKFLLCYTFKNLKTHIYCNLNS